MKSPPLLVLLVPLLCIAPLGCHQLAEEEAHGESRHGAHSEAGEGHAEGHEEHQHKIVATSPVSKDVVSLQQYVCQIHSCRHIEVRALKSGYLEEIKIQEGQKVQQGDLLFKILPTLYQAQLESDIAEAQLVQIEYDNTRRLVEQNVVSPQELALAKAKLDKAQATVRLARAELNFADVKAPFTGIIDRLHEQQGSLIEEGDMLTTLSDNSTMWVYFNVPEARYLEYEEALEDARDDLNDHDDDHDDGDDDDDAGELDDDELRIELKLANGRTFPQTGSIGAIEADFNNETGNIPFRADFPNPKGLLRHGQTGTVMINRLLEDAIVIPQRATYEILDKRYVYVIDEDDVVHQRQITIQNEMDDIFVIQEGLQPGEKIVLEGTRQVRDGEKVEYEFRDPIEVLGHLKNKAE